MKQSFLKYLSFGTLGLITLILIVATITEKIYGTRFVSQYIYGNPLVIALWAVTAIFSLIYLIRCHTWKRLFTFSLHLSFPVILTGALITHIYGVQGVVHLRCGSASTDSFTLTDGTTARFPFSVSLVDFQQKFHKGTFAPMDYVSTISITQSDGKSVTATISMNNIYSHNGYRFYQSGYDKDYQGAVLSISHDPAGIAVTYTGYLLLLVSIIGFFLQKDSTFRRLLKHPLLQKSCLPMFFIAFTSLTASANALPATLPDNVADKFGDLYIYYNDRVCPMETFAKDFTAKLCGKTSYNGLSANQVLTGWFFFYDDWKQEPMIKIKGSEAKKILGISGNKACLTDFIDINGYKLENSLQNTTDLSQKRELENANEKFNLISMVSTGSILKIYPYRSSDTQTAVWLSFSDRLPSEISHEQWAFIKNSMSYVAEKIAMKDYNSVIELLDKIALYQRKAAGIDGVPTGTKFQAEKLYNDISNNRTLAMVCITIGIIAFLIYCRQLSIDSRPKGIIDRSLSALLWGVFLYLTFVITLRAYISNHIPLSNGFETMQFLAWCSVAITLIIHRRFALATPFGYLLCGLTLLVAMIGESNPQITQLMPVLQSPLLSIHVVVIMVAYSLLAFAMLNGLTAIILQLGKKDSTQPIEYLQVISRLMLYPAVFLLAAGIFIGAVWANVSWGRYWGWDPKEVWALITMIVYAFALHASSLPRFRNPMFFHRFCVIAFITVLITYFGVNFFLGGMHSYA